MLVTIPGSRPSYCEGMNAGFQFMLVNEEGKGWFYPIQCKDYITDLGWCETMKQSGSVYGFPWTPGTMDITAPWHYLAVRHTSKDITGRAKNMRMFLNEIEEALGYPLSSVAIDESEKWLVITFSERWWRRPYLISAFTQYARVGAAYEGEGVMTMLNRMAAYKPKSYADSANPWCSQDSARLPKLAERTAVMMTGKEWTQEYKQLSNANAAHNSGIVGMNTAGLDLVSSCRA